MYCKAMTDIAVFAYVYHMIVVDDQGPANADANAETDAEADAGPEVEGGGLGSLFKKKTAEEIDADNEAAERKAQDKATDKWLDAYVTAMKEPLVQLSDHAEVVIQEGNQVLKDLVDWANGQGPVLREDVGNFKWSNPKTATFAVVPEPSRDRSAGSVVLMVEGSEGFLAMKKSLATHVVWPAEVLKEHLLRTVLRRFPFKRRRREALVRMSRRPADATGSGSSGVDQLAQGAVALLTLGAAGGGGGMTAYDALLTAANAEILKPIGELDPPEALDEDERRAVAMFTTLYALFLRGTELDADAEGEGENVLPMYGNDMSRVLEGVHAATSCMVFATYHTKGLFDRGKASCSGTAADPEHDEKNRVFVVKTQDTAVVKRSKSIPSKSEDGGWEISVPPGCVMKQMLPSTAIGIAQKWIDKDWVPPPEDDEEEDEEDDDPQDQVQDQGQDKGQGQDRPASQTPSGTQEWYRLSGDIDASKLLQQLKAANLGDIKSSTETHYIDTLSPSYFGTPNGDHFASSGLLCIDGKIPSF